MRGLWALCVQDAKRLLSNALFWVVTVTLAVIVLVVNFALPAQLGAHETTIYSYNLPQYAEKTVVLSSKAELEAVVAETESLGLVGSEKGIEVIHTGVSEKTVRGLLQGLEADDTAEETILLHEGEQAVPFNKQMTPVFICFEALVIGFILGGALLLSEKEEGTVKALRIAPVSAMRYVLSKTLLFAMLGTAYAILMAVFCVGGSFNWVQFILLSFVGSALFTLLGLGFTSFFKDMSSWFFSAALLLGINMLTAIPYYNPSLSLAIMRVIPSYPIIFAYRDILFGSGMDRQAAVLILAWCLIAFLFAFSCCKHLFLKRRVKV